jgi:hypothetical protein
MPTIHGHKLRWVEDEVPCTECGEPHDGKWFMVSVMPGEKLLCRDCLPTWKAEQAFHGGLCSY